MARLATGFLAAAMMRRVSDAGGFAAVLRKGDETAGALFLLLRHRDGSVDLAAPAPQSFEQLGDGERQFERRLHRAQAGEADALLAREARFDSDLWVIEFECAQALFDDLAGLKAV